MSQADRVLWQAAQRRAAQLSPSVGLALLAAYAVLRNAVSEEELARAVDEGGADAVLSVLLREVVLATAFQPVRERIRSALTSSVRYYIRQVPVPPTVSPRQLVIAFDTLNPRVVTAVRALESRVITDITTDLRAVVRAFVEQGLLEGKNPVAIARGIRPLIGVPASRELWIENYSAALRGGPRATVLQSALDYELRDKRFDLLVKRAIRDGTRLTDAQIERMTAALRKNVVAFSAETVARTATLDALKLGQRLSWQAAAESGHIDRSLLTKRWVGVMDARERPTHRAMEGDTVHFDEPFRNGQMIPGDDEYNCRCIARYSVGEA